MRGRPLFGSVYSSPVSGLAGRGRMTGLFHVKHWLSHDGVARSAKRGGGKALNPMGLDDQLETIVSIEIDV